MATDPEQLRKDRAAFLKRVYELSEGDENVFVNVDNIGGELHFDSGYTEKIVNFLAGEFLVKRATRSEVRIEHAGVVKAEDEIGGEKVEKLRKDRAAFLKKVYALSQGDEHTPVGITPAATELGFDIKHVHRMIDFLKEEGLVKWLARDSITITHDGIAQFER